MNASDVRKLKALEEESAKLKRLLAEKMLDNSILKVVAAKKWQGPILSGMELLMFARSMP